MRAPVVWGVIQVSSNRLHMFEINGKKLVLDVESDALHRVDDLAWEVISLRDDGYDTVDVSRLLAGKYAAEEIGEAVAEVETLQRKGLLWAEPGEGKRKGEPAVKALCLNVAHSCNLSCRYCFAGKGNYGEESGLMPAEVGQAAVDFLLEHSAGRQCLEVDFFGGEPLLNMGVVKEVTAYARNRCRENGVEINFTLTTNGLLLNEEITSYLRREGFSVILSLDGRPGIHDRMRRTPGNAGSYARVKERLLEFTGSWKGSYYVRGTFTRYNRDFCRDVAHLVEMGFRHVSLEPVVASAAEEWSLQEEDLPLLEAEYEKLADYYLQRFRDGQPFTFFHFAVDPDKGPCLEKRLSGCGAGDDYLAVTPGGDLYPCHQLVGDDALRLGNVFHPREFSRPSPVVFPPAGPQYGECRSCWARYHCGGGCRAASRLVNGSFHKPYALECALQKKRLECALYILEEKRNEMKHKEEILDGESRK